MTENLLREKEKMIKISISDLREFFQEHGIKIEEDIFKYEIPKKLSEEIEKSKKLLELKDGWNSPESKGYKLETLVKVNKFLILIFTEFHKRFGQDLIIPYIDPGINGAIDLHWKTEKFEMHLTIPERDDEPISYYGDNYGPFFQEGCIINGKINSWLSWMKEVY